MKITTKSTTQPAPTTRQRILEAASSVFAADGFGGARVDEIARRAGVNKALLYYHVGNKQALYTAVLLRNFDRVEAALADATASGLSAGDRLSGVIAAISRVLNTYPDHPRIVLREIAAGGNNLQKEVLERMVGTLAMVANLLAEGVRNHEFRVTDPVMAHLTLVGSSLILNAIGPLRDRAAEVGLDIPFPDDDADTGAFLSDLILYGIATPRTGETS